MGAKFMWIANQIKSYHKIVSYIFICLLFILSVQCGRGGSGSGSGGAPPFSASVGDKLIFETINSENIEGILIDLDGDQEFDGIDLNNNDSTCELVYVNPSIQEKL